MTQHLTRRQFLGSAAAASKARRSAAVMPACVGVVSTRMILRSIVLSSDAERLLSSSFIIKGNDR